MIGRLSSGGPDLGAISHRRSFRYSTMMLWLTSSMALLAIMMLVALILLLFWLAAGGNSGGGQDLAAGDHLVSIFLKLQNGPAPYNSEGIFAAIVGTVAVTLLMTVIVSPLGVIVAIYLHVYARETWYAELIRIGIHNLAGVPSIIYGVFGLGFFVYVVGGQIDQWFFSDALPKATFGTPGLLWASVTLVLLTLPTVIVATEEGLARLPSSLRDGSLALGATRFEMTFGVLIPAAMSSLVTGIVLAIARAAGEVAPLMLVGVVKYAPSLPLSGQMPFVELEQKFMHLGFLVYDLTLHAPTGDGRMTLIAAIALVLVLVVMSLTTFAAVLRGRFRMQYAQEALF